MGHRGSCSRSSPNCTCWRARSSSKHGWSKPNRSRVHHGRCSQQCMHRILRVGGLAGLRPRRTSSWRPGAQAAIAPLARRRTRTLLRRRRSPARRRRRASGVDGGEPPAAQATCGRRCRDGRGGCQCELGERRVPVQDALRGLRSRRAERRLYRLAGRSLGLRSGWGSQSKLGFGGVGEAPGGRY